MFVIFNYKYQLIFKKNFNNHFLKIFLLIIIFLLLFTTFELLSEDNNSLFLDEVNSNFFITLIKKYLLFKYI